MSTAFAAVAEVLCRGRADMIRLANAPRCDASSTEAEPSQGREVVR